MTKEQEIKTLQATAKKLGPDSYMGPWLTRALPFIESAMRSDMPFHTIEQETITARETVAEGERKAKAIIEAAEKKAEQILDGARRRRNDLMDQAARTLQKASGDLEQLSARWAG